MILPNIDGNKNVTKDSFYFGCDSKYFNTYGIPLVNSLKVHAPWSHIHIHLFNPTDDDINWCNASSVSVSYENIDPTIPEINTYYACVRFIRIPEIFNPSTRIISLDCDGIVVAPISKEKFMADTDVSKLLWRQKQQKSLASSVFFGPDDFRVRYADKLKPAFDNDSFRWYLDQNVMDAMIANNEVAITEMTDWGWPKIKSGTLIWTGKGDRKHNPEFQELLTRYKNGLT